jgi:YgiT-type zinc finger domain-containing protein
MKTMKCQSCGSEMVQVQADLPFNIRETTTVIVKTLPVLQCQGCGEHSLEDSVVQRLDKILERAV